MSDLTPEQIQEIKDKLNDQVWRLNNLYWITDISGHKILFKLNKAQEYLLRNRWFMNLVLKARQHGITTFVAIFFLDAVLFGSNQKALIIAHTQGDARKIFDTKIKFAFDNLPEWLKMEFRVDADNINSMKFETNGGEISVATSGRSGTYQYLHISEFGIICFRYPEKAAELVSGSLNTVHAGESVVFIESTAKGRFGYFYDYCQQAMAAQKREQKLTPLDFRLFFYGWQDNPLYTLEGEVVIPMALQEYFKALEEKDGIVLTRGQKNWYVKKWEKLGEEMFSEFPTTPDEAFKASIEGAYFTKQLNRMYADRRVGKVPHDASLQVYTFWDLGVGDETVILFVQFHGKEIRLIDEYYATGEGLQHYARVLQERAMKNNYVYGGHYAPHDIEVRELGSNAKTRREIARGLGITFKVVKKHAIDVGIDDARVALGMVWIDEENCAKTLGALQSYRKEFDEKLGTWGSKPLHSWESHYADAFRMLAESYKGIMGDTSNTITKDSDMADDPFWKDKGDESFNPHSVTG